MLKTFALRGRELPMTIYGPPGLRDLFGSLTAHLRAAHVRLRARSSSARATSWRATATSCARSRSTTACRRSATRSSRTHRPGRFDVDVADALGVPPGPERGALQAGEEVQPARRTRRHAGRGPRASATRQEARARRATPRRFTAWSRRPPPRTCSSTRRRSSRTNSSALARPRTRRRGDAAGVAREAGVELLALTHLSNRYSGPRRCRGGTGGLPGDGRAEGLRYHRASLQGARNAAAS